MHFHEHSGLAPRIINVSLSPQNRAKDVQNSLVVIDGKNILGISVKQCVGVFVTKYV